MKKGETFYYIKQFGSLDSPRLTVGTVSQVRDSGKRVVFGTDGYSIPAGHAKKDIVDAFEIYCTLNNEYIERLSQMISKAKDEVIHTRAIVNDTVKAHRQLW